MRCPARLFGARPAACCAHDSVTPVTDLPGAGPSGGPRYDRGRNPTGFEDVETGIGEAPADEPQAQQRQWRIGRAAVALTVATVMAGTLAAGASALTSTAQAPTRPAAK